MTDFLPPMKTWASLLPLTLLLACAEPAATGNSGEESPSDAGATIGDAVGSADVLDGVDSDGAASPDTSDVLSVDAKEPDASDSTQTTDTQGPTDTDDSDVNDSGQMDGAMDTTDTDDSDVNDSGQVDGAMDTSEPDADSGDTQGEDIIDDPDGGDTTGPPANACLPPGEGPSFKVSSRGNLRWKRVHALERDLLSWMKLTPDDACSELGINGVCFNLAHLVPLGGNDPIYAAMYSPIPLPGLTSMISTERVTVSLCGKRVDEDAKSAEKGTAPAVFKDLDFTAESVDPEASSTQATIEMLYRLMLARDPSPVEVDTLKQLAEPLPEFPNQGISPRDFAKTACFVVATTSEALLH